jgi:hypothetical protein
VYNNGGTFTMSGGAVSGNTSSSSSFYSIGGGVYNNGGTFTMLGGAVSGNSSASSSSYSSYGGGVYNNSGTFTMSGGAVSGNSSSSSAAASSSGGGVYNNGGTFTMSGGTVSGNSASAASSSYSSSGGGVYVSSGTFTMSGGAVNSNTLSGANSYGREVYAGGTFKMSGDARPERVFLFNNAQFITISGPLSGPVTPIDLGVRASAPLANYVNQPILKLDASYPSGDMANLKNYFSLGNSKQTDSPDPEEPITGYKISDTGLFVAEEE